MRKPEMWPRFFKATPSKAAFAKSLVERMTVAERKLWAVLSQERRCRAQMWRRQVVIKGWIVDFYNEYTLTVIEVDGGIHSTPQQQAQDRIKDSTLASFGLRVLRISNDEIFQNIDGQDPRFSVQSSLSTKSIRALENSPKTCHPWVGKAAPCSWDSGVPGEGVGGATRSSRRYPS